MVAVGYPRGDELGFGWVAGPASGVMYRFPDDHD